MKKMTLILRIFFSILLLVPSVVFAADYTISIDDVSVNEGGTAVFTVSLNQQVQGADVVTVAYTTASGTAVPPGDYSPASDTLSFTAPEQSEIISVATIDDGMVEYDENFFVNLSIPTNTGGNVSISDNQGESTIVNDDTYGISINDASEIEGSVITFTVTLEDAPIAMSVDVSFATSDGTATLADNDYTDTSGTVTFPSGIPGQTQDITVSTSPDSQVEPDETFTVTLSSTDPNANFNDDTGTGTIQNDDAALVSIVANDAVAAEPADDGQFTVTMTNTSSTDTVISYNVTGDA
ncbi:MAG: hypothetical protein JSV50_21320, partial [Desulfobacteraceae bacterium]